MAGSLVEVGDSAAVVGFGVFEFYGSHEADFFVGGVGDDFAEVGGSGAVAGLEAGFLGALSSLQRFLA